MELAYWKWNPMPSTAVPLLYLKINVKGQMVKLLCVRGMGPDVFALKLTVSSSTNSTKSPSLEDNFGTNV